MNGSNLRVAGILLAVLPSAVGSALPAEAYPRPGRNERVSVRSDELQAEEGRSSLPYISATGRFVLFHSWAINLTPESEKNKPTQLYLRDRAEGRTELISVSVDGKLANDTTFGRAQITPDGRHVVFESWAANLVSGDENAQIDVFLRDRDRGETTRISVSGTGAEIGGPSFRPRITPDGRYVAFDTVSALFPADTNGVLDVHLLDRATGRLELVSVATDGTVGDRSSYNPAFSADGRFVAFHGDATNFDARDFDLPNGLWSGDVFVRDRLLGTTEMVSVNSLGEQANGPTFGPEISADGRHVAFVSHATNLVPTDTSGGRDLFVHDRITHRTERVSLATDGTEPNTDVLGGDVAGWQLSADARFVVYYTDASTLVPGDGNGTWDTFVHDRLTGVTERVSLTGSGGEGNAGSSGWTFSSDARHVAFESFADNLVPDDTNRYGDVFVHDRGPDLGVGYLDVSFEDGMISGWARFPGEMLASMTDPVDASPGAAALGAEILAARVTQVPEEELLVLRLDVNDLPGQRPPSVRGGYPLVARGGLPAVVYGIEFRVGGVRYQARASRMSAAGPLSANPPTVLALFRCDVSGCMEVTKLKGGFGTAGQSILWGVPLAAIGAAEGDALIGIRGFTAPGEVSRDSLATADEVSLPDTVLLKRLVLIGFASPGTPEDRVDFDTVANLDGGSFSGTLSMPDQGAFDFWARACLGNACRSAFIGWP